MSLLAKRHPSACFLLVGIAILCIAGLSRAGITGKISGTVSDEGGVGLPGAAVVLENSRLGATTDADGRYVILQVQPGTHTVTASLIGYSNVTTVQVRANADRTTVLDFELVEEAIEMSAVVVVAKRPPIETDVTSSQIVIDAERVAEAPVSQMLDYLSYEPGVSVSRGSELSIRGGGQSEVRFQVDGLDRTDGITSKGHMQLNQVLVSEVTVLTGGFNAEYGNVRAGMVNVVTKDGTERGFGMPWVSGVFSIAPTQSKHFGPGAYDQDQYDYAVMSSQSPLAESTLVGPVLWPNLYEETRTDTAMQSAMARSPNRYEIFPGWTDRATSARNTARRLGSYGKKDWEAEEVRAAWEWEANMNEQVWQYGHKPDWNLDLAGGWALPSKLGGVVIGYSHAKVMTAVPALVPYYQDRIVEGKLTLTPIDNLKLKLSYARGASEGTGGGAAGSSRSNPELAGSGANVLGNDPGILRSTGELIGSIWGNGEGNNKLHLSYNNPSESDFTSWGATLTYAFGARTFVSASLGRTTTNWDLQRDLPRVDVNDFDGDYKMPVVYGFGKWLQLAFAWSDTNSDGTRDYPSNLADARAERTYGASEPVRHAQSLRRGANRGEVRDARVRVP